MSYQNKPQYQYQENGFVLIRGDDSRHPGDAYPRGIAIKLEKGAKAPSRATPLDAGADLCAWFGEDLDGAYIDLAPGEQKLVDTGVAVKIPAGYGGFVMPRSSMRAKGVTSWGDGLIDSGYRGNIKIVLSNQGNEVYKIYQGDRIGQLVIQQVELVEFVDIWNDSSRGTGGFGSTGK
jgi:dUTP pyrophosphatase